MAEQFCLNSLFKSHAIQTKFISRLENIFMKIRAFGYIIKLLSIEMNSF